MSGTDRELPPVEWVDLDYADGCHASGMRAQHPEGVECDFSKGQCSCGRLGLGLVRDVTRLRTALDEIADYDESKVPSETATPRIWNAFLNVKDIARTALDSGTLEE